MNLPERAQRQRGSTMKVRRLQSKWMTLVAVLSGGLGVSTPGSAIAQSVTVAQASIAVPPVVQVRSVSTLSTQRVDARRIEVTQRVVTAANTSYSMTVLLAARGVENGREPARVFVRSRDGAFVTLQADTRVSVSTGERGSESVTSVVFRIEAAGVAPDSALARVLFRPVASAR